MTGLPKGWITKTLGEVAVWGSGGTPQAGNPRYYGGEIPWAIIGDLNDGEVQQTEKTITQEGLANSSAKMVPVGALLIAMYGSIGKMGIAKVPMATNQAIAFALPKPDQVIPQYLFWYLRSQREIFLSNGKGATQQNISQTLLKAWEIPVPPLDEQRRIVETLDYHLSRLDKALAELDHADSQTQVLRRSILNELLNPAPSDLERGIGQMTTESALWEVRSLKDWGMNAQTGFASGVHNQTQDGVAHLRPMNVSRNGAIDLGEVKYVSAGAGKHRLESGDILFNNTNSDVLVGKTALFSNQGEYAFSNHMTRLRFPEQRVYSKFMASRLHFLWMEGYFKSICNNHVSQASVSTKALSDIQVALPPLDEQKRIVLTQDASLSRLDFTRTSIASQKASIQTLRRSLLNKAFNGELGTR